MSNYIFTGKRREEKKKQLQVLEEKKRGFWLEYNHQKEAHALLTNEEFYPSIAVADLEYTAISLEIESIIKQLKLKV